MKNEDYWKNQWNKSAKENKDIRFISGWGNRTFQEILFASNDISRKLELDRDDIVLEVGCGAGLFELLFTRWVKEIHATDYSEEMIKKAKSNTKNYKNVTVKQTDIRNMPYEDEYFDKVIVNSVIQYLENLDEVKNALAELKRVVKKGGKILVSMNLDSNKKKNYYNGYYKLGFSDEEIKEKIATSNKSLWFDRNNLKNIAQTLDVRAEILDIGDNIWHSKYYFDLLIINDAEI